jgi:hypothetical protein
VIRLRALLLAVLLLLVASVLHGHAHAATDVTVDEVYDWLHEYAAIYEVDVRMLIETARCESVGFHPDVLNGRWLGKAGEVGVAQFTASGVWLSVPVEVRGESRYDVERSIAAMAWAWSHGKQGAWTCARRLGLA